MEKIIKSIGFFHVKSKRIIEVAKIIDKKYKGKVPDDLDTLVQLPGVGRKTANCVLVYAFEKPAIPVDIHVHRISNRLGLVDTKHPEETEQELMNKIQKKYVPHNNRQRSNHQTAPSLLEPSYSVLSRHHLRVCK